MASRGTWASRCRPRPSGTSCRPSRGASPPAFDELIRQAAQGEVLHDDDTTVKILELMGPRGRQEALAGVATYASDSDERRGLYTSGVVALRDGHRVALFFSGRRHAGENLARVLAHR